IGPIARAPASVGRPCKYGWHALGAAAKIVGPQLPLSPYQTRIDCAFTLATVCA
ncbi:unnamed protein product, partial [Amoebophrya sp. A120]